MANYITSAEPIIVNFDPPLDMRKIAAGLNLLPVLLDMGGCVGIQPSGEVSSFVWENPSILRIESDERVRNIALFECAKKFPELSELKPIRSATSKECDYCKGSGMVAELPAELAESVRCYCGGLGWIP